MGAGCRITGPLGRRLPPGQNGSIVAGLEGVNPETLALKPSFLLFCDGKTKKSNSAVDDDKVVFTDAEEIGPGDLCALEVRLPEPEKVPEAKGWQWYGYNKDKKDVGLLYGSNKAEVGSERQLELELYKLYAEAPGDITVTTTPGGACLKLEKDKCLDRRVLTVERPSRMVLRVLALREGETKPTALILTAGDKKGVGLMAPGELTAEGLTKAMTETEAAAFKVNVFKDFDMVQKVLSVPFDQSVMDGKLLEEVRTPPADLTGLKVLDIVSVWTHGWDKISSPQEIDKLKEPRWMAKVTAEKGNEKVQFVVGGSKKYFVSTAKVKATNNGKSFFVYYAWPDLAVDIEDGASDLWKVYAVAEGGLAPKDCKDSSLDYYLGTLGALTEAEMAPEKGLPTLEACEIKGPTWRADIKTWSVIPEFYLWRWSAPR